VAAKKAATKSSGAKKTAPAGKSVTKKAPADKSATKKAVNRKTAAKKAVPKKKVATSAAVHRQISSDERRRMIAEAAYLRAESQGFFSDERQDWLIAEAEIDSQLISADVKVSD
jgi:hypothetical protein